VNSDTQNRHLKVTLFSAKMRKLANRSRERSPASMDSAGDCGLAPVTFSAVPAPPGVDPPALHPDVASARRALPASGHPDVASAFPAVKAGNPDEPDSGSGRWSFDDQRRRRHADVNPRSDRPAATREQQQSSQGERKKKTRTPDHEVLRSPPREAGNLTVAKLDDLQSQTGCVRLRKVVGHFRDYSDHPGLRPPLLIEEGGSILSHRSRSNKHLGCSISDRSTVCLQRPSSMRRGGRRPGWSTIPN
jgi:hypothetical protein